MFSFLHDTSIMLLVNESIHPRILGFFDPTFLGLCPHISLVVTSVNANCCSCCIPLDRGCMVSLSDGASAAALATSTIFSGIVLTFKGEPVPAMEMEQNKVADRYINIVENSEMM